MCEHRYSKWVGNVCRRSQKLLNNIPSVGPPPASLSLWMKPKAFCTEASALAMRPSKYLLLRMFTEHSH